MNKIYTQDVLHGKMKIHLFKRCTYSILHILSTYIIFFYIQSSNIHKYYLYALHYYHEYYNKYMVYMFFIV